LVSGLFPSFNLTSFLEVTEKEGEVLQRSHTKPSKTGTPIAATRGAELYGSGLAKKVHRIRVISREPY
jgi:hypothetical protein